jgi:hypothetical protein
MRAHRKLPAQRRCARSGAHRERSYSAGRLFPDVGWQGVAKGNPCIQHTPEAKLRFDFLLRFPINPGARTSFATSPYPTSSEIPVCLHPGIRTVQRWEIALGNASSPRPLEPTLSYRGIPARA